MSERKRRMYMGKIGLAMALSVLSLSACGEEKNVDYTIEGITESEQPQSEGGKSGLSQFEGEKVWVETVDDVKIGVCDWGDVHATYEIDAEIIVPQVKQMAVVEVEAPSFDAEFRENIATSIFETGEIYYGDVAHMPRRDLQEIQSYLAGGGTIAITPISYGFSVNVNRQKLEDLYAALEHIDDAPETYTGVAEYTTDEYVGTYAGQMYRLIFGEYLPDSNNQFRLLRKITFAAKDLYQVCPEEYEEVKELTCSAWTLGDWMENQCEISEEDARKEAEAFIEKLGLDYPVLSYTYPLLWGTPPKYVNEDSASGDWGLNGYVFCFDLGVDDISFVSCGTEEDYSAFGEKIDQSIQPSMEARLQIYVTDKGVIRMVADNPMEIINVAEGVELLPLDTVKSVMKEAMSAEWEALSFWKGCYGDTFDEMELLYFRVSDKENPESFSYVPAWRLAAVTRYPTKNKIRIDISVLINAIDGSFINLHDET